MWGEVVNQKQIGQLARQMAMMAGQQVFDSLAMQHKAEIMEMRRNRDQAGIQALQEKLSVEANEYVQQHNLGMSAEQAEAYTTIGGTPHLDGQYTVFGEVEEGLEVVGEIQKVETDKADRPKEDIVILGVDVM